ncbi:MAG: lysophospholipid acyltransferase family protein [Patescibacteria group bacterium]
MVYAGFRKIFGPLAVKKIRRVEGEWNLPPQPPFILAANHVGFLDAPALVMHILGKFGQPMHTPTTPFMWKIWGERIARKCLAMIPLYPGREGEALIEMEKIIKQGGIVGIFPEGGRNPHPDSLLRGKTGAVRLALATGAPLIPIGLINTTGFGLYKLLLINLWRPSKYIDIKFGQPVDLAEFRGQPVTKPLLIAATRKLMRAIGVLCGKAYNY